MLHRDSCLKKGKGGRKLKDGSIAYVDKLYVEFHNVKVDVPVEGDRELLTAIKKNGS